MSNMSLDGGPEGQGPGRMPAGPRNSSPAPDGGWSDSTGEPSRPGEGAAPGRSMAARQAAREAILDPREQLRSAVALQIGQLNELAMALQGLQDLVASTGSEWSSWIERSVLALDQVEQSMEALGQAKRDQEALLANLRQGWVSVRDEDTARLETGLRNLASASQALEAASGPVCGCGTQFSSQVQEVLQALERRLPELAAQVSRAWEQSHQLIQVRLTVLGWIGGVLGLLVAADTLARVLK